MTHLEDELRIIRLLNRFANHFDLKQWQEMEGCLTESLHTDYSDLRGTPPEILTAVRFVALRREALDALNTHHLYANHDIELRGDDAQAKVSAVIYRKNADGATLHTHGLYLFGLRKEDSDWKICAITQKVYWSDGKQSIHSGITKTEKI